MPSEPSSSARVTFLDIGTLLQRLSAAARRLCADNRNVAAVVLFGSLADGTATPASDIDLLVLLRGDRRRVLDRVPDYTVPFEGLGMSVQVLPWTVEELLSRKERRDPWAAEILHRGRLLAGSLP
jgi:predicted nucleotidyltransferase